MSSRNAYLSAEERARALGALARPRARGAGVRQRESGARARCAGSRSREVEPIATSIDYVTVADADALVPFADDATTSGDARSLAIACRIGKTRLIDNVVLGEDPARAQRCPRG